MSDVSRLQAVTVFVILLESFLHHCTSPYMLHARTSRPHGATGSSKAAVLMQSSYCLLPCLSPMLPWSWIREHGRLIMTALEGNEMELAEALYVQVCGWMGGVGGVVGVGGYRRGWQAWRQEGCEWCDHKTGGCESQPCLPAGSSLPSNQLWSKNRLAFSILPVTPLLPPAHRRRRTRACTWRPAATTSTWR